MGGGATTTDDDTDSNPNGAGGTPTVVTTSSTTSNGNSNNTTTTVEFVDVGVGLYHACALSLTGKMYCWGVTLEKEFAIKDYRLDGSAGSGNNGTNTSMVAAATTLSSASLTTNATTDSFEEDDWVFYRSKNAFGIDFRDVFFLPKSSTYGRMT